MQGGGFLNPAHTMIQEAWASSHHSALSNKNLVGYPYSMTTTLHAVAGGFAGFLATSLGGQRPFGVEGWRVVFLIVAAISALVGCIVALLAADPRRKVLAPRGVQHRFRFLVKGFLSTLVGCIVALLAADPRRKVRQNAVLKEPCDVGLGLDNRVSWQHCWAGSGVCDETR